jgi:hypothetical protein
MKDNRDFLEGVYKKAEILKREKIKKTRIYRNTIRFGTVAAAIAIIISLAFNNINLSTKNYIEIPQVARSLSIDDPMTNFYNAENIVIGKVKNIGKSQYIEDNNYIYTDITIQPEEVFLGNINEEEITLRVKGGKIRKEKIFSPIEGRFKKKEKSLLFLYEQKGIYYLLNGAESQFLELEDNVFEDKQGNKYSIEDIKNNIDRRETQ